MSSGIKCWRLESLHLNFTKIVHWTIVTPQVSLVTPLFWGEIKENAGDFHAFEHIRPRRISRVESLLEIADDRFCAGAHMEPFKNALDMTVDSPNAYTHSQCDFLVHATCTH